MKHIHYIIIATHLSGDGEVKFFPTRETADKEFESIVRPLITFCEANKLSDDVWSKTNDGYLFNGSENEELDIVLEHTDNTYYGIKTVEVADDVDYYLAEFEENVDESTVHLLTHEAALIHYTKLVTHNLEICNSSSKWNDVDRFNPSTWDDEEYGSLFKEDDNLNNAWFGYEDFYFTYRYGKIL
jgi:hypothetical protein